MGDEGTSKWALGTSLQAMGKSSYAMGMDAYAMVTNLSTAPMHNNINYEFQKKPFSFPKIHSKLYKQYIWSNPVYIKALDL